MLTASRTRLERLSLSAVNSSWLLLRGRCLQPSAVGARAPGYVYGALL